MNSFHVVDIRLASDGVINAYSGVDGSQNCIALGSQWVNEVTVIERVMPRAMDKADDRFCGCHCPRDINSLEAQILSQACRPRTQENGNLGWVSSCLYRRIAARIGMSSNCTSCGFLRRVAATSSETEVGRKRQPSIGWDCKPLTYLCAVATDGGSLERLVYQRMNGGKVQSEL